MIDPLRRQADRKHSEKTVVTSTLDGESEHGRLSHADLDLKARAVGADLLAQPATGAAMDLEAIAKRAGLMQQAVAHHQLKSRQR